MSMGFQDYEYQHDVEKWKRKSRRIKIAAIIAVAVCFLIVAVLCCIRIDQVCGQQALTKKQVSELQKEYKAVNDRYDDLNEKCDALDKKIDDFGK